MTQRLRLRGLNLLITQVMSRVDGAVRARARRGLISSGCRGCGRRTATTGQMQSHYMCGIVERHSRGDSISPVTAMRGVTRVAKPCHQLDPHARYPFRVIAPFARLAREAETRHRRDDNVK